MTGAFAMIVAGGVLLMAAIRNRSIVEVMQGITSPAGATMTAADSAMVSGLVGGAPPRGMSTVDGHPVCAWIAAELVKARARGWGGSVTSGYRSAAEQAEICAHTSGPCATPGQSNHQGTSYPRCAVDVSDPAGLAAALPPGSPLHWTGRSIGDDVHFSSGLAGV